jgi:hypothetical protein
MDSSTWELKKTLTGHSNWVNKKRKSSISLTCNRCRVTRICYMLAIFDLVTDFAVMLHKYRYNSCPILKKMNKSTKAKQQN